MGDIMEVARSAPRRTYEVEEGKSGYWMVYGGYDSRIKAPLENRDSARNFNNRISENRSFAMYIDKELSDPKVMREYIEYMRYLTQNRYPSLYSLSRCSGDGHETQGWFSPGISLVMPHFMGRTFVVGSELARKSRTEGEYLAFRENPDENDGVYRVGGANEHMNQRSVNAIEKYMQNPVNKILIDIEKPDYLLDFDAYRLSPIYMDSLHDALRSRLGLIGWPIEGKNLKAQDLRDFGFLAKDHNNKTIGSTNPDVEFSRFFPTPKPDNDLPLNFSDSAEVVIDLAEGTVTFNDQTL
jgi:hypothetical protein